MRQIPWEHAGTLLPREFLRFGPFHSILDVGGGPGTVGRFAWGTDNIHVLDAWQPETIPCNFTLGNGLQAVMLYGMKSFDLVLACEMLEHLPKALGPRFLSGLEDVARKLVVITTPYGFAEQDPEDFPDEPWAKNPYQKHLCGWLPDELQDLGFEIILNGINERGAAEGAQIIAWKPV